MTTDITNVQNAFMMLIRIAVRSPAHAHIQLCHVPHHQPQPEPYLPIAVVFLAIVLGVIMVVTMKIFNQVFSKYDDLNASVAGERLRHPAWSRPSYARTTSAASSPRPPRRSTRCSSRPRVCSPLNNPAMMIAVYFCIIMVSWLGAHYIVAGDMTTGDLTSLFSYVMSLLMSLMMLSMVIVMISMSMASIRRISEVLNEKPDLRDPAEPISEVPDGRIDFDHVSFSYKHGSGEAVLSDIDLHIKSGETIGVIGGTGSGKSSLVNLICRLYDVDKGAVRVGGIDVRNYDMEALRNQVAVVLQKNTLFSGTILDNLRWGNPDATEEQCIEACRAACADEFIDRMPDGYNTRIERGRQQRLRRPRSSACASPAPCSRAPRCSYSTTPPAPWTPPPTPKYAPPLPRASPARPR